jgi:hypothetical protein
MKKLILMLMLFLCVQAASAQSEKDKRIDTTRDKPTPTSPTMFRMHYADLFRQNADATWSPKQPLMINGEMVGTNIKLVRDARYGGLDLLGNFGHDAMVDTARGVVIIHKFVK